MPKKGKNLKFYLSAEDQALYEKALEEDGFQQRGPHLMHLINLRNEVRTFQYDRAKEVNTLIKRFKISQRMLETAGSDY